MSTNGSVHTSYQVEDVECNENQSPLLLSLCVTLEKVPDSFSGTLKGT